MKRTGCVKENLHPRVEVIVLIVTTGGGRARRRRGGRGEGSERRGLLFRLQAVIVLVEQRTRPAHLGVPGTARARTTLVPCVCVTAPVRPTRVRCVRCVR